MGLYAKYCLPTIVNLACNSSPIMRQREKIVPIASGVVLEVGIGSGLNLSFLDSSKVEQVYGLDPSIELIKIAEKAASTVDFDVTFLNYPGEEIPLENKSVDSVLLTYTLCTIPNAEKALTEIRRVLKPDGELIFSEHGLAPDFNVQRWQNRFEKIWKKLGGGCHLNRPIPQLIEHGGFIIQRMESMYLPGWKPANYNYWGIAVLG